MLKYLFKPLAQKLNIGEVVACTSSIACAYDSLVTTHLPGITKIMHHNVVFKTNRSTDHTQMRKKSVLVEVKAFSPHMADNQRRNRTRFFR